MFDILQIYSNLTWFQRCLLYRCRSITVKYTFRLTSFSTNSSPSYTYRFNICMDAVGSTQKLQLDTNYFPSYLIVILLLYFKQKLFKYYMTKLFLMYNESLNSYVITSSHPTTLNIKVMYLSVTSILTVMFLFLCSY